MPGMMYPAIVERGEQGFGVFFPDLPGCVSAGASEQEAALRAEEALAGHLLVMAEFGDPPPPPSTGSRPTASAFSPRQPTRGCGRAERTLGRQRPGRKSALGRLIRKAAPTVGNAYIFRGSDAAPISETKAITRPCQTPVMVA